MDSTKRDGDEIIFCADDVAYAINNAGLADVGVMQDEKGTLVIGPWDEPYTAYQRVLARLADWLAEAHMNYQPEAFFEIHLLGGILKLRENGDLILNVRPLMRGYQKLFDWMWDKGLP